MANFASRIKELRQSNNLSQRKLADELGVSQVAITHWENQSREPSISTIEKIAEFFHVTPAYMVGWDEIEEEKEKEARQKIRAPKPTFSSLEPGEFLIDITRENYEKYPEWFDLIFEKLNDLEPAKFNGFVIDSQSGNIMDSEEFKELTKRLFTVDDNLEILKRMDAKIKYNPETKLLTIRI